jgi:hypothetical protein
VNLTRHQTAEAFLARCRAELERNEVANNLMVGIGIRLQEHPERTRTAPYLATVEDAGAVVAAAVMTPPFRLIVHSERGADPAPLRPIVQDLLADGWPVPGVLGPAEPARAFAGLWSAASGRPSRITRHERVYALTTVFHPQGVPGALRAATEDDLDRVSQWILGFHQDIGQEETPASVRERAEFNIANRDLYLWDHAGPVSMAAHVRRTTHGAVVALVYTPPEHRNHGYASACVAALSQRLLDAGWQFCALFTDLANPTSNSIYQRIGYRPVCDFDEYDFETKS